MMKRNKLLSSLAALAACIVSTGAANAAVVLNVSSTTIYTTYAALPVSYTVAFDFVANAPSYIVWSEYRGAVSQSHFMASFKSADIFTGVGVYDVPVGFAKGVSIIYKMEDAETAVPEASTWAMMLIGLGAIGVAARRRQTLKVSYI